MEPPPPPPITWPDLARLIPSRFVGNKAGVASFGFRCSSGAAHTVNYSLLNPGVRGIVTAGDGGRDARFLPSQERRTDSYKRRLQPM